MRVVIQRVTEASVVVNDSTVGAINTGVLILLGIVEGDTIDDIKWLSKKIVNLRIFNDENEVMNRSLLDINGEALVVSQFTLHASTKKGNRPSYSKAAKPPIAIPLYENFIRQLEIDLGKPISTGIFGADMQLHLINNGPVTIIIDSSIKE